MKKITTIAATVGCTVAGLGAMFIASRINKKNEKIKEQNQILNEEEKVEEEKVEEEKEVEEENNEVVDDGDIEV